MIASALLGLLELARRRREPEVRAFARHLLCVWAAATVAAAAWGWGAGGELAPGASISAPGTPSVDTFTRRAPADTSETP